MAKLIEFPVDGEEGKGNRDRSVWRGGRSLFVGVTPLTTLLPSLIAQIMIMSGENSRINQPNIECPPARPPGSGTNDHLSSLPSLFGGRFSAADPLLSSPHAKQSANELVFPRKRTKNKGEREIDVCEEKRDRTETELLWGNFLRALLATRLS